MRLVTWEISVNMISTTVNQIRAETAAFAMISLTHFHAHARREPAANCVSTTKMNVTTELAIMAEHVLTRLAGLNAVVRQALPVPDVKVILTNVWQILVMDLAQQIVTS